VSTEQAGAESPAAAAAGSAAVTAPAATPIQASELLDAVTASGIELFTGVPDSLLKDFIAFLAEHVPGERHVTAANEGGAVALATGYHLATGGIAAVYLQNSGLGNTVNPLTSLADPEVYGIPLLLIVGWRGKPGVHDEPQHRKQGAITLEQLEVLGIPTLVLDERVADVTVAVRDLVRQARGGSRPVALVVPPGRLAPYKRGAPVGPAANPRFGHRREAAIEAILATLGPRDVVVSTTGMASREVFEHRERAGEGHGRDFLTVGGMGHASQIALGVALARPDRTIVCIDGDGAAIMHLGALAIIGTRGPANLRHVILNNGAHDSVGGQPTAGFEVDLIAIANACGYRATRRVESLADIPGAVAALGETPGPTRLEVRVDTGARSDLGRPTATPAENKAELMAFLRDG
jgi:phosphonopyruvate decarboxylase